MARSPDSSPAPAWLPDWARGYGTTLLRQDAIAGLTTGILLVPQGMAYAMLAGLPPVVGLYASVVPLVAYALVGTSRELAVGPVAIVSLLTATGIAGAVDRTGGEADPITLALALALLVGVLQTGMGLLRMGFLVQLLSHPVVSGFTSAAAIVIGTSQLPNLLGLDVRGKGFLETVGAVGAALAETHVLTLALGGGALALLLTLRAKAPRFPGPLFVMLLATGLVVVLGLDQAGVAVVGAVPTGLPQWSAPWVPAEAWGALLPTGIAIALVGFMESVSVAQNFARKGGYRLVANRELLALGGANLAAAFTSGYPVTGGFSRTAVNATAGAKTPVASLVSAGFVLITLLFLTPLFAQLPKSALAALIMMACIGLIDGHEVKHLWKVERADLALLAITFTVTLLVGVEEGILSGVLASMLWLIANTTRPHIALLGRLPGTTHFRNLKNHPDALAPADAILIRLDAQLYYGNVAHLDEVLRAAEQELPERLRTVVLDASAINRIDSTADAALRRSVEAYRARGVAFGLAGLKVPVRRVLQRSGCLETIGEENLFLSVHEAVEGFQARGLMGPCQPRTAHGDVRLPQALARAEESPNVYVAEETASPRRG